MRKSDKTSETSDSEAEINSRLRYEYAIAWVYMFFCGKNEKKNSEIEMVYRSIEKNSITWL